MKTELSISRTQTGDDTYMSLTIRDTDACIELCKLTLSPNELMLALTGQLLTNITTRLGDTGKIGKVRESRVLEFPMPEGTFYGDPRKAQAVKEGSRICPEGWEMSTYFSSQSSFFTKEGRDWARTSIMRWVEK